jgi:hypothetical protein
MEQMEAWLAGPPKLPQYAAAIEEHGVDGDVLLGLVEREGKLAAFEIANDIHQATVRGALAGLGRTRAAEGAAGGTDVARAKRARLAGAGAEVTPGPAAVASVAAAEGGGEQTTFQQAAARLELAAPSPPAETAAAAAPVFAAQSAAHGRHFYVSKPSAELRCPLCLKAVAEQPAALRACGHIFCRGCLLTALAADRRCPTCQSAAGGAAAAAVAMLVTPAHTVASLIDELPVRCPHGVAQQPGGGAECWLVAPGGCDAVLLGLHRIIAFHYHLSTAYQIRDHMRCLSF